MSAGYFRNCARQFGWIDDVGHSSSPQVGTPYINLRDLSLVAPLDPCLLVETVGHLLTSPDWHGEGLLAH